MYKKVVPVLKRLDSRWKIAKSLRCASHFALRSLPLHSATTTLALHHHFYLLRLPGKVLLVRVHIEAPTGAILGGAK